MKWGKGIFEGSSVCTRPVFFSFLLLSLLLPAVLAADVMEFRKRLYQLEKSYSVADVKTEVEFGRRLAGVILTRFSLHPSEKLQKYVSNIGRGISALVGRPELNYHFAVLDSELVNTFSTPGGYVFVSLGALRLMDNEAQLAGVVAHELSHIDQRLMVEKLRIRGIAEAIKAAGVAIGLGDEKKLRFYQWTEKSIAILFKDGRSSEGVMKADEDAYHTLIQLRYDWKNYRSYLEKAGSNRSADSGSITEEAKSLMKMFTGTAISLGLRLESLDRTAEAEGLTDYQGKTRQKRFKAYAEL